MRITREIWYHVAPRAVQRVGGGASYGRVILNRCRTRFYCQSARTSSKQKQSLHKQFQSIKSQYEDYILLFQVGDFYELYDADASAVADKTSLRITKHPNSGMLMAGFPKRSLNEWSRVLVKAGFQLAICNQAPGRYYIGMYEVWLLVYFSLSVFIVIGYPQNQVCSPVAFVWLYYKTTVYTIS